MQEQLIRKVSQIGNGAHIFVPKEWMNEDILIVRTIKQNIEEKILEILNLHLEDISAIFLYGSYARNEQTANSDIDILVISDKKFKIEKKDNFEIIILEEDKIKDAIKINPVLIYSILNEARPIINSSLLEKLKEKYQPKTEDFKEMIRDTKRLIKINGEFLDLEEKKYTESNAEAYSLILRLRGIFIINMLLSKKEYNKKLFDKWIKRNVQLEDYNTIYTAYLSAKRETKEKSKILVSDLTNLLGFLNKETLNAEKRIKNAK